MDDFIIWSKLYKLVFGKFGKIHTTNQPWEDEVFDTKLSLSMFMISSANRFSEFLEFREFLPFENCMFLLSFYDFFLSWAAALDMTFSKTC